MLPFPTGNEEVLPVTLNHSSRSTTYELVAALHCDQSPTERFAVELIMEKFDQLPIWGMYSVPQTLVSPHAHLGTVLSPLTDTL